MGGHPPLQPPAAHRGGVCPRCPGSGSRGAGRAEGEEGSRVVTSCFHAMAVPPRAASPYLEPQQVGGQQPEQLQDLALQLVLAEHDAGGSDGRPREGQHLHQQGMDGAGCRESGVTDSPGVTDFPRRHRSPRLRSSPPTASLAKTGRMAALEWPSSRRASAEALGTTRTLPMWEGR